MLDFGMDNLPAQQQPQDEQRVSVAVVAPLQQKRARRGADHLVDKLANHLDADEAASVAAASTSDRPRAKARPAADVAAAVEAALPCEHRQSPLIFTIFSVEIHRFECKNAGL